MDIIKKIAEELEVKTSQVDAAVKLIDEGCTIPFIARYRKEVTGALNDEQLPLSLSLRLFGNVMSGTVLMGLIYDLLKPFTIGYPALLHAYFDLFSGCIQAYVFCMLTMVYVNDKIAD